MAVDVISKINDAIINNLDISLLATKYSSILRNCDYIGFKPFFLATLLGRTSHIEILIKCNANLINEENIDSQSPLYIAADIGHQNIISLLIKNNAIVNKALYLAIKNDNTKILQNLINKSPNLNTEINNNPMIQLLHNYIASIP